jgi:hippurate hydrolase
MITIEAIQHAARTLAPEVQQFREHIHSYPELSFEETATAAFVSGKLREWGISFTEGWAGTGIVAVIEGRDPEKTCTAIRSELDALPILEENTTAYTSKHTGIMHACGHDAHTACLLGVARLLQTHAADWEGTVKLIFQPGEEKHPGGGSLMLQAGVIDQPKVDRILALHVYPTLPAGDVGFRKGQYMASTDEIHITIQGKGGHAALPHQTIDPITIAAYTLVNLQQLVSRRSNPVVPCVLSFGKIAGGIVNNVIPDTVTLSGTLRTMDEGWRTEAHRLIKEVVTSTCATWGAKATVEIPEGYPSLYNDPELTGTAEQLATAFLGANRVHELALRMTADDFAFYGHQVPGCYFRLGTAAPDGQSYTSSVHTSRFDIDPAALETGTGLMAYLAMQLNNQ